MSVNFTPQARDDLATIRDWIAHDDERAADIAIARIVQTAMMFGQFPMLGRAGVVEDTREFSVVGLPYLIVYQVASETEVDVLTVIHTAALSVIRKLPPLSAEVKAQLAALAAQDEAAIDTGDAPELSDDAWASAQRGRFYRPVKQSTTVRIDSDVLHWLKSKGRGYQTRINAILRAAMARDEMTR